MNARRQFRIALLLAALLSALSAYGLARWLMPYRATVAPLAMNGEWIAAPGSADYQTRFRKVVDLNGEPRNAWVAIAACDSFELTVNGTVAGQRFLWRPTRPFQNGLSEDGQKVNSAPPILALNFPREYQWEGHRNYQLPVFIDITPLLRAGRNSVCVEVESRSLPPRMIADGEIELRTGARVPLASDASWKAAPAPDDRPAGDWTQPEFSDLAWPAGERTNSPPGKLRRTFDPRMFHTPFDARWIRSASGDAGTPVSFDTTWHLDAAPSDAWIRLLTHRSYDLFINGCRVGTAANANLDRGQWVIGAKPAAVLLSMPELLDPNAVDDLARREGLPFPNAAVAGNAAPGAPAQERNIAAFNLYDVRWMLKRGDNKITVRLNPPEAVAPLNGPPQFALDGEAADGGDRRVALTTDDGWTVRTQAPDGSWWAPAPALAGALAAESGDMLPPKNYRGCAIDESAKFRAWLLLLTGVAVVLCGGVALVASRRADLCPKIAGVLLPPVIVITSAILLEVAWGERHEALLFLEARAWAWVLGIAAVAAAVGTLPRRVGAPTSFIAFFRLLPGTKGWKFLIIWLLIGCGFLRAYRLDFQPLDDDEYASTQAALAIAEHGVPKYTDEVFYTRSPLHHYVTGAVVKVFGGNIWALRLPGVAFAVATALLLYLCGARLLGSRWLGLAALALYTIHPFAIYSAHLARFYQQQQFFALLTAWFFVMGFVSGQSMRARYGMLASLLAAVLSQEMSVVLCAPIGLGCVLFAARKPWRDEVKFFATAACVVAVIAVDIAIFKTRCLTRVEGVSPNVAVTISPNFSHPMNFLTTFIACSRLHLVLSILLVLGLPFAFRRRSVLALHVMLFAGVIFTSLFVNSTSPRYQYWLLPFWILLGLQGMSASVRWLGTLAPDLSRNRWLQPALACVLFAAVVLSWSPWRIPRSYGEKLVGDSTSAFRYVNSQLRPGDAVAATEPHPHAALLEAGRVDYDLSVPLLHDFLYEKNGKLIDRNGGAQAIGNVTQLQEACARHPRLWVIVNREKLRSRGRNIRREYPGARVEEFMRTNMQVKYRSYLWTAYLWDANSGIYSPLSDAR